MKILVIEDNPNVRTTIIRLLRRMYDADVCWAETADAAIEHLKTAICSRPFDLIISDYTLLDGQTGADVLDWIRMNASQVEDRFMFFTSNDIAKKLHRNFVEKPCDATTLRTAIDSVLNSARS